MLKAKPNAGRASTPAAAAPAAPDRLLWSAQSVLELAVQLRATGSVADLSLLRERIRGILQQFQAEASAAAVAPERVTQATEILAALIDHAVTSMPWGADAGWQSVGMAAGRAAPRRPAQRLLDIARASSADAGMRELLATAVLLGFDKRSRGEDDAQIEQILTQLAAYEQPASGQSLAPEWKSAVSRRTALSNWLPFWVSLCVFASLLAVLFFVLELSLGTKSDRVYAQVAALRVAGAQKPQLASNPRLATPLASEMAGTNVFVRDEVDRSYVIVPDKKLFAPGEAALLPDSASLLRSLSNALQGFSGRIQIIAHTDRTLDRSARYPSDWDLSVDRARAVQQSLRDFGLPTSRMTFDGRGSIEPLSRGDPARAVSGNGRIEIILLVGR